MRTTPRSACAPTISPTATVPAAAGVVGSLLFDDLEDDLAIRARRGGIQDGADRLRRATLLPDDAAEVLLRHLQLEDRRRVTLRFLHLHRLGTGDEMLRQKQHQFLHGSWSSLIRPCSCGGCRLALADELRHRLRRLRALLEPSGELFGLELDEGG